MTDERELPPSDFTAGYELGLKLGYKRGYKRGRKEAMAGIENPHTAPATTSKFWERLNGAQTL